MKKSELPLTGVHDKAHWQPVWDIDKFLDPTGQVAKLSQRGMSIARLNRMFSKQYLGRAHFKGNLLLNSGINVAWGLICGAGGTAFDNTHAYIGVGDSSASPSDATKTGIQAATNRLNKAMDATYPLAAASQAEVWRSTFGTSDANFAWNEITVSDANDFTHALNRLVSAMGTKASGATWIAALTITLS
ncbi:MAG: hypothetical protein WB661_01690 [Candidatus Bathyarchaeia archaeon]